MGGWGGGWGVVRLLAVPVLPLALPLAPVGSIPSPAVWLQQAHRLLPGWALACQAPAGDGQLWRPHFLSSPHLSPGQCLPCLCWRDPQIASCWSGWFRWWRRGPTAPEPEPPTSQPALGRRALLGVLVSAGMEGLRPQPAGGGSEVTRPGQHLGVQDGRLCLMAPSRELSAACLGPGPSRILRLCPVERRLVGAWAAVWRLCSALVLAPALARLGNGLAVCSGAAESLSLSEKAPVALVLPPGSPRFPNVSRGCGFSFQSSFPNSR